MTDGTVTWVRIGDVYPDMKAEADHFIALDGGSVVGVVRLVESGPDIGRWHWSMVQVRAGKPFSLPRSGTTRTRSQAAFALVGSWRAYQKWYGIED